MPIHKVSNKMSITADLVTLPIDRCIECDRFFWTIPFLDKHKCPGCQNKEKKMECNNCGNNIEIDENLDLYLEKFGKRK